MADELKRVGLVFKQDGAVDFKKTLQEVNLELNKNYNQFKLVQGQWDKSTTSTQKLRAEQEYLRNAYEIQADKVSTLKMQLSDLENAEEKNTTAIKKKRNELTNAELKLETYNKRIKDIESQLHNTGKKIEEFGTKVENVGGKIEKAGKKMSAFSGAIGAALVASAKGAIDFESAFAGVEKTVDGTEEQMAELKQGIRDMAKEIPSTTTEISAVAEAAGQLGIQTENILGFSKAMIDLGNSTNLSSEEAASQLAKFANITKMSQKDFDKLGSAIVDLGNNFATTEADIVNMAMRLAGAGNQVGMSQGQILGLATALSSVGIEAEMGGSAISKAMVKMQNAVELGGGKLQAVLDETEMSLRDLELMSANNSKDFKDLADSLGLTSTELKNMITAGANLRDFSKVAGMSADDFKKAWKEDATGALTAFIKGLGKAEDKGESAITLLSEMGLTEVRLRDSLLRAANASDLFSGAIKTGTKAWEENTALTNEANKRYQTLKSKIQIMVNKIKDLGITFGNKLMPVVEKVTKKIEELTKWVSNLTDEQVEWILKIAGAVVALGPLLTILGKVTGTVGGVIKGIGTFTQAIGVMSGTVTSTSTAVNGLASVLGAITSPAGIAVAAIGLVTGAVLLMSKSARDAEKETKKSFGNIGTAASDFVTGIDSAQSHLGEFNRTLFVTSEEQQKLQQEMGEVQQGITTICRTASDERRGYTQKEIQQLDEYFEKLRQLNQRELEIEQSISKAIAQQAATNAETFQGSLEEYKIQSQEWIKTAEEQKAKTIELLNTQTTEEIALLNQRYGDEAIMSNEAYANEYNKIVQNKTDKIAEVEKEIAEVNQRYADGYLERAKQNDGFYTKLQEYNKKVEDENASHQFNLDRIENNALLDSSNKMAAKQSENEQHQKKMKKIWQNMYKDMDESQENQLGTWLALVSQTEMYGGEIDQETKEIVDGIIDSYDSMPKETREAMKNAMSPMLDEMNKKQPTLFAKATTIANGILTRLRKAFDEHSPSRETRQIMQYVMQPMEEEMEKGKKELFKQADEIGDGITDRLENIDGEVNLSSRSGTNINQSNFGIDYNKMAQSIASALTNCKFTLDEDGFARIVKDELYKVV